MSGLRLRSALAPWAGLFLGAGAWFVHQQAGANANYWDCRLGGPLWTALLAVICGFVAALGGWLSWREGTVEAPEEAGQSRRFASLVGAATAAIFGLAILFQTLGGLIVPACRP